MDSLALTLVIVFGGVVLLPPLARRTGLPIIVAEILFGIIIGKSLFNLVPESPIVDFFSTFGLVYLMFLAGLETDLGKMRWKNVRKALAIGLVSVAVPFAAGYFIAPWVGINRLLLGTILCTTSLGLILPILRELNLPPRLSRLLLASVILVDIVSLFLLAFVLATIQGQLEARLFYSLLGIVFLFLVPWIINKRKWRRKITAKLFRKGYFEMEMRVSFALIFLLGAVSLQLGFHSIIGAFIAGLLISEILPRRTLESAKVNLLVVFTNLNNVTMLLVIIAVGMLAKIVSVAAASRLSGVNMRRSLAFGLFHTAMLSLILAMADISIRLGLIGERLFSIFVILALVTSTVAPALGKYILGKKEARAG
jgi:Kef-type K+ transport system membrane component KefB